MGGVFIWEETKAVKGMGEGTWERTGMEQEKEDGRIALHKQGVCQYVCLIKTCALELQSVLSSY